MRICSLITNPRIAPLPYAISESNESALDSHIYQDNIIADDQEMIEAESFDNKVTEEDFEENQDIDEMKIDEDFTQDNSQSSDDELIPTINF